MTVILSPRPAKAVLLHRVSERSEAYQSPKVLEETNSRSTMETNGMTLSDLAALEKLGNRHRGAATTGLALGAVALGVGIVGLWGMNAASQSRSRAAEQLATNSATRTSDLYNLLAIERSSRETWQRANQPSLTQYVDVQTNPNLSAQLMDYIRTEANASATATANSGLNSAIANDAALRVHLYQPPIPCQCNCGQ